MAAFYPSLSKALGMSTQTAQDDFRIQLEAFEGPLDLLLFLIRRAEVDIIDIPVARVADEYLAILRQATTDVDVEAAGEFLVMAATLVELKSRTLMPPQQREDDDASERDADPRATLIQQLLDYQRIRLAAEGLVERRDEAARRFNVQVSAPKVQSREIELDLEDVHAMDLAEAYERIASSIDFDRLGDHVVAVDDTPVALHQADLLDRLQRRKGEPMELQALFAGCDLGQRVGFFLATLELVRLGQLSVAQSGDGPITLALRDATAEDVPLDEDAEVHRDPDHAIAPAANPEVSEVRSTDA
ncbi:MAG: segregation/condensation protein A [Phycisphaerales bacterium]|nr:segregation/condensation protein A [Phycisphaerales bacterium]